MFFKHDLINCKELEKNLNLYLKNKVELLASLTSKVPTLATVLVGENPSSQIYVKNKIKKAEKLGIKTKNFYLDKNINQQELLDIISSLNDDTNINGILVQLPLEKHLDTNKIIESISPLKDVDGLSAVNLGKSFTSKNGFIPCTPLGVLYILKKSNITLQNKHVVILGRSQLVGIPTFNLMLKENALVTIAHSYITNLKAITKKADVLIVATGQPYLITKDYVKRGASVIDVGINSLNGKVVGDVHPNTLKKARFLTPVPKGVGILTTSFLMYNTLKAFILQNNINVLVDDIF